jgi:hypothetical protein
MFDEASLARGLIEAAQYLGEDIKASSSHENRTINTAHSSSTFEPENFPLPLLTLIHSIWYPTTLSITHPST